MIVEDMHVRYRILPQLAAGYQASGPKLAWNRPDRTYRCGMLSGMRAVVITRPGGPEVLEFREVPDPVPGPEELLVRVRAAALNRADLLQRRGLYPGAAGRPGGDSRPRIRRRGGELRRPRRGVPPRRSGDGHPGRRRASREGRAAPPALHAGTSAR